VQLLIWEPQIPSIHGGFSGVRRGRVLVAGARFRCANRRLMGMNTDDLFPGDGCLPLLMLGKSLPRGSTEVTGEGVAIHYNTGLAVGGVSCEG
jgi:hypothetical protein